MLEFWVSVFYQWGKLFTIMPAFYIALASFVIVATLGYFGWLQREFFLHKVLTALYYIYIPITCFMAALTFYATSDFEKSMYLAYDKHKEQIITVATQYSEEALTPYMKSSNKKGLYPLTVVTTNVRQVLHTHFDVPIPLETLRVVRYIEIDMPEFFNTIPKGLQISFSDALASGVNEKLQVTGQNTADITYEHLVQTWSEDIEPAMGGMVTEAAHTMIENVFATTYTQLLLFWGLLLAMPAGEIFVYQGVNLYYARKDAQVKPA